MAFNIIRTMIFDANRAQRAPCDGIKALADAPVFNEEDRPEEEKG